jgi:hypothetical protein
MGHSRTPTQNTAGDGFQADPIDGPGVTALAGPGVDRVGRVGARPGERAVDANGPAVGQPNSQGRCLMPLMKLDSR